MSRINRVAILTRAIERDTRRIISPQRARHLAGIVGWSKVKAGCEWPARDGSGWVGRAGPHYYVRPGV